MTDQRTSSLPPGHGFVAETHAGGVSLGGRLSASDAAGFVELGFDVPEGVTRLDARLEFPARLYVAFGLAEPGLKRFPDGQAIRGWSTGERREAFIALDAAAPGYHPGPIPAGRWHLILRAELYGRPSAEFSVELDFDFGARATAAAMPAPSAHGVGAAWLRGDLHCHTFHSDARASVDEVLEEARERGLRFLAVTDHNTNAHHADLRRASSPELLLLPGQELTTDFGHANVFGGVGLIDFRVRDGADVVRALDAAAARGAVLSVNHPTRGALDWKAPVADSLNCFEVWNSAWSGYNARALARYDALLASGRRLALVGGSDRHKGPPGQRLPLSLRLGSPTTSVEVSEPSEAGLLDGLRRGRTIVSESPTGPTVRPTVNGVGLGGVAEARGPVEVELTWEGAAPGDRLRLIGAEGVAWETVIGQSDGVVRRSVDTASPYLRAEIVAGDPRAWVERLSVGGGDKGHLLEAAADAERSGRPLLRTTSSAVFIG